MPRPALSSAMADCVSTSSCLRLKRSATSPATGARKSCGPSCSAIVMPMAPASCRVRWSKTSQSWAVRCIQVPMLEIRAPMNQVR